MHRVKLIACSETDK